MADKGTWKIALDGSTLVDYADVANPRDNDGGPLIQSDSLFRGPAIVHRERNNFELHLIFDITITQANNADAVSFFLKGPQTWCGVKDVVLSHKDHTGTETSFDIDAAAVRLRCQQPIGVLNLATLTIDGQQIHDSP